MEKHISVLQELQKIRGTIPTYALFDGINPFSWITVEKELNKAENGQEVDLILNSGGGTADEAYKIIRAFHKKYNTVNVIVPFWAKSAATLVSFGATRLVLHGCGELGPIDAQIKKDDEKSVEAEMSSALIVQSSLAQIEKRSREGMLEMFTQFRTPERDIEAKSEIRKIGRKDLAEMLLEYSAKFYSPLLQKIDPKEMGQMARVLDIGRMYARRILKQYTDTSDSAIDTLLYFLVYECPDHGYVVDHDILKSFLPFVIKSDEDPFGPAYDKKLGELSMLFIQGEWPKINSFVSSLAINPKTNIIKTNETTDSSKETKSSEAGGPGSGPAKDTDTKVNTNGGKGDQANKSGNPPKQE